MHGLIYNNYSQSANFKTSSNSLYNTACTPHIFLPGSSPITIKLNSPHTRKATNSDLIDIVDIFE